MRIEKINDHQIRCTLNQKDLKDREIRISELAYGTEKAKALFRDMMQQASYEFGFEVDDIPLMIEAIPMLPDALVLVITKVEDPDELDVRFSHFTDDPSEYEILENPDDMTFDPFSEEDDDSDDPDDDMFSFSDTLLDDEDDDDDDAENLSFSSRDVEKDTDFISLSEALGIEPRPKTPPKDNSTDIARVYQFQSLQQLCALGDYLQDRYHGKNTVYKNQRGEYFLILHKSTHTPEEYNRICNIVSEYGSLFHSTPATASFFEEHYQQILADNALQTLRNL